MSSDIGRVASPNIPVESKQSVKATTNSTTIKEKVQNTESVSQKMQEYASKKDDTQNTKENRENLKEWVSKMNVTINEKVRFDYSEDFGGIYVTVVDKDTQEVIRKIPTEDAIKLSKIWKEAIGNIFDHKG